MEIFVEPDGEVVIADLLAELLPVARALDEQAAPSCPVSPGARQTEVPPAGPDPAA